MQIDTHSARAQLEHAIEDAIAFLDFLDPDPDLEETGDLEDFENPDEEPSLGSLSGASWSGGGTQDLEHEHDGREPEEGEEYDVRSEDEPIFPSLGAAIEQEAAEMRRVAAFIEGRCQRLIDLEQQAVRA